MKSPYQQQLADLSAQVPSVTVTMTYYEASFVRDALSQQVRHLHKMLDSVNSGLLRTIMSEQVRVLEFSAARVQRSLEYSVNSHRNPKPPLEDWACKCAFCTEARRHEEA